MASLDEATKQLLAEKWLPRVRELRDQRKPMVWMMTAVILALIVVALTIVIYPILKANELDMLRAGASVPLLGLAALGIVYLGRLQSCNDVIVAIEFTVYYGDREQIIKSISQISCLGKMQDLLRDIRPFLKGTSI